jgi:twitching motility protein PilI
VARKAVAPILLLHELDRRSRVHSQPLPQQLEVKHTWDGVSYRLGENRLVTPMEQVREILTSVSFSRLPGVKPWVRGVANVRGNLLPILDLHGLVLGELTRMTRRSRVLVLHHQGIHAGLMVDEVLGMRHFFDEEFRPEKNQLAASLHKYMTGTCFQEGETWGVLDIHRLVEMPEFTRVAA